MAGRSRCVDSTSPGLRAASTRASADMVRWALVNTGGGEVDGTRVLSAAALRELHAPNMALLGNELSMTSDLYTETRQTAYGLGWVLETYRGHRIVHHGGNIDGFSAMVSLLPSHRVGVVVLTNLNGTGARGVIPYVVFDLALGLEPLPWGERLREFELSLVGGAKEALAHAAAQEARCAAKPPARRLRRSVPPPGLRHVRHHARRRRAGAPLQQHRGVRRSPTATTTCGSSSSSSSTRCCR